METNQPMTPPPAGLRPASNRHTAPVLGTALALLLTVPLLPAAAEEWEESADDPSRPQFSFLGEAGFIYQAETDLDDDGGGDLQVNRYDAAFGVGTDFTDRLRWSNTFFAGVADYEFDGGGFAAGNPWDTVLMLRYGSQLAYQLDERWAVRAGGVLMFSRETDADWSTSFTGGGVAGVDYRHSEKFFVTVGLGVTSQLEDDAQVVPAIGLSWLPADDWTVRVGAVPVSGGALAGGEVEYRFNEPLALGLGVLYSQRRFRLDDEGVAPDGVGEETSLPLRLRLGWSITPQISLHFLAGVVLGGELDLEDQDGNGLREADYDPAPYFGVRFFGRF